MPEEKEELFNVVQFFEDGSYEYVRRFVNAKEAIDAFQHYTTSVGARIGTTIQVIITDSGDFTNMHWVRGKGIVFPTKEMPEEKKEDA